VVVHSKEEEEVGMFVDGPAPLFFSSALLALRAAFSALSAFLAADSARRFSR
jgi:hypothetical protein